MWGQCAKEKMFPLTQWMYYFLTCITGIYCFIDLFTLSLNLPGKPWGWKIHMVMVLWFPRALWPPFPPISLCFYSPSPQTPPSLPSLPLASFWKIKTVIRTEAWAGAGWFFKISIKHGQLPRPSHVQDRPGLQSLDSQDLAEGLASSTSSFHIF